MAKAHFSIRAALAAGAFALAAPVCASAQDFDENLIIVGAITDGSAAPAAADSADSAAPELPVVYETAQAAPQPEAAKAEADEASARLAAADLGDRVEAQ